MSKFPSRKEILEIEKLLENVESARPIPRDADAVDVFKYSLCREILSYKLTNQLTLDDVANTLSIQKTDVSKIINYHISRYTIDKLMRLVLILYPSYRFGKVG